MDKIFIIIKREFMERVRSRWFIIMTLLMPAILAAMVIVPAWLALRTGTSNQLNRIIIIDASGAGLGQSVVSNLKLDSAKARIEDPAAPARPDIRVVAPADLKAAEDKATLEVQGLHSYSGYLALTDTTLATGAAHFAGRNASAITDMARLEAALRQSVMMVRLGAEGVKPDVIRDISKIRVNLDAERISEKGKTGSANLALVVGFFLAFMIYISIILHGQNLLSSVVEEKTSRVAEIILSSVKPDVLLAGKVLGVGAVGIVQQLAWYALSFAAITFFMPFVTHGAIRPGVDSLATAAATPGTSAALSLLSIPLLVMTVGFFLTGFLFYAALYAAAGSMVNSDQEARQAALPVMMPLIITIVLLQGILMNSSGPLAVVLSWLPFSSPIVMPARYVLGTVSLVSVAGSWIISALSSAFAIWLSGRIYRVGMLMYGKKPNMAELLKWIRYAG